MNPCTALDAALGDLLQQIADHLGAPVPAPLRAALHAAPRHLFLPPLLWLRDGNGGYEPCDRAQDPERWWHAAYRDAPLVTQFTELPDGDLIPSSSASMPSMVIRMLRALEARPGQRVLEIGTGTGFNAALLSHLYGSENVTSVDIDPDLIHRAERALRTSGHRPSVRCADGAEGWPPAAPYDAIIATCAVRTVPRPWLDQTATGGRIVTPWDTAWCNYGTLIATKQPDGTAEGFLAPYGSFMLIRSQQVDIELHRDVLRPGQTPERSTTRLSPWSVAGNDLNAQAYVGLSVPGVWHSWDTEPDGPGPGTGAHTRLWLADDQATSWASVDYDGHRTTTFAVSQYGPRNLWDEVTRAHAQYVSAGRPTLDRLRLHIHPEGPATRHEVRLATA
ncbi:methyltransferase [Streptomyces sp. NRRL F-4489]|uniref:methyltransferase domain-containing protein n=1 Tax=Streptomyces sp. NRRL F-4489 TaxID=1609095 RepID=UPI0007468AF5|nr:methyltransferase domain-containing protein [Streptomyces sp. NRRL F-4489]KUL38559.1 methyltransferase [Streptomyces sp. NRRL F-4489]